MDKTVDKESTAYGLDVGGRGIRPVDPDPFRKIDQMR
jgi:hypothetical protein